MESPTYTPDKLSILAHHTSQPRQLDTVTNSGLLAVLTGFDALEPALYLPESTVYSLSVSGLKGGPEWSRSCSVRRWGSCRRGGWHGRRSATKPARWNRIASSPAEPGYRRRIL